MIGNYPEIFEIESMSLIAVELRTIHHPRPTDERIGLTGRAADQCPFLAVTQLFANEFSNQRMRFRSERNLKRAPLRMPMFGGMFSEQFLLIDTVAQKRIIVV